MTSHLGGEGLDPSPGRAIPIARAHMLKAIGVGRSRPPTRG